MSIELYQRVALTRDVPEQNLQKGDIATVVENLPATKKSKGEPGYALEVFNVLGETTAVVFVPASAVRSLRADEMPHVRSLAKAVSE